MNIYEFLAKSEKYTRKSIDDYNSYHPYSITGINQALAKITSLLQYTDLQQEDDYTIVFPTVWVEFEKGKFGNDIIEYVEVIEGYWLDEDAHDDSFNEELLNCFNSRDEKSFYKGGITVWKGKASLEFRVFLGNYSVMFNANEDSIYLFGTHLTDSSPTLHSDYVRFQLDVANLVADEYLKMHQLGKDEYYPSLNVDPTYRHGYMTVRDYQLINNVDDNSALNSTLKEQLLTEAKLWEAVPRQRVAMTRDYYLGAAKVALEAINVNAIELTAAEAYQRYADGRHEGLLDLDDTAKAFETWKNRRFRDTSYAEIYPTSSKSTAIFLFVESDEQGDYLRLYTGELSHNYCLAIRMADALRRSGYPVQLSHAREFATRLSGNSIVVFPAKGTELYDKRYFPHPKGLEECLIEWIEWDTSLEDALRKGWPIKLYELDT